MADPIDSVRWRDELLQLLYWLRGEGLGESVAPQDLTTFLGAGAEAIGRQLDWLIEEGYVAAEEGAVGRYRLTEWGAKEAGRRFADEFAGLTGQGHGECSNPGCACQTLGPEACTARTAHTH